MTVEEWFWNEFRNGGKPTTITTDGNGSLQIVRDGIPFDASICSSEEAMCMWLQYQFREQGRKQAEGKK